jgi:hypothetical protein
MRACVRACACTTAARNDADDQTMQNQTIKDSTNYNKMEGANKAIQATEPGLTQVIHRQEEGAMLPTEANNRQSVAVVPTKHLSFQIHHLIRQTSGPMRGGHAAGMGKGSSNCLLYPDVVGTGTGSS